MSASAATALAGNACVGPNAIIQVGRAISAHLGEPMRRRVFEAAGLGQYLRAYPERMIPEGEAARLLRSLDEQLEVADAQMIAAEAGKATGAYILEHRIPLAAKALLRLLPRQVAGRLLLKAIAANAWTFAGSGSFRGRWGRRPIMEIANNPLAVLDCRWHVAVFETLFRSMVCGSTVVTHTHPAEGRVCRFVVDFPVHGPGSGPLDS